MVLCKDYLTNQRLCIAMFNSPSICAIIPTFNRANMIQESINSILAQTRPVREIIIVDDGSTDDTASVVTRYGDRVIYIRKENGGRASALNVALQRCKSDYVLICDDDDIVAADGVEHLAAALDSDATADFAYGTYQHFRDNASGRTYGPPVGWDYDDEPNINIRFLESMFTHLDAMLVRFSLYLKVGPFRHDLARAQDYDMTIRLSRGTRSVHVPKVIFFYREHQGLRGPMTDLFSADQNVEKWLFYKRKVLGSVRQDFTLRDFTPTFALQWGEPLVKRAALLERSCVFARHHMWKEASDDLRQASELSPTPATPEELHVVERVIYSASRIQEVLYYNSAWLASLKTADRTNRYTRDILFTACRPLIGHARYSLRQGNIATGIQSVRILVNILGVRDALSRILRSLLN